MKVTNRPAISFMNDADNPAQRAIEERNQKLMELSKKFEAIFVNQMVGSMRKTVHKGGLVAESQGEKIFRSMLDYEHSQKIAQSGQVGLAQMIYDHLLRTQMGR